MPSTTSVSIAGPFFVCKVNNMSAFGCFSSKVGVLKWVPCQSFGSRAVTASTDIRTKRNCLCFFSYCLFWRKRRARGCGGDEQAPWWWSQRSRPWVPAASKSGGFILSCKEFLGKWQTQNAEGEFPQQSFWEKMHPSFVQSLNCRTPSSSDSCLIVVGENAMAVLKVIY